MAQAPDQDVDPWDADVWTIDGLDIDKEEIAHGEQDARDEAEDFEAYRERVLAPLRRLAQRLRAEEARFENEACERMGSDAGEAGGQGDPD